MIQASNISLRFGKKALFEEVNIKFTEGNCYGIIGANGAGKSTFLKILSGELEPTTGEISLGPGERLSVLEQDHFKYDDQIVLDTVIAGNQKLYDIMEVIRQRGIIFLQKRIRRMLLSAREKTILMDILMQLLLLSLRMMMCRYTARIRWERLRQFQTGIRFIWKRRRGKQTNS